MNQRFSIGLNGVFLTLIFSVGLNLVHTEAWGQALSLVINAPTSNSCVPNNPPLQPGGSPDEAGTFLPSSVPFSFTVTEPNGADVTLTATINGQAVSLTSQTVFTSGPGIATLVDYYAIEADQVADGQNLVFELTAQSPAGSVSDSVTFDLDRLPPSLEFTQEEIALYNACSANANLLMNSVSPSANDEFDPAPTISYVDQAESCTLTRIFTVSDHCGEGNAQEVYFQIAKPSADPAEFYFAGAEDGEFYLETYSYFGTTDTSCFTTNAQLSIDGGPDVEVTTGSFFDSPGSYRLNVSASDCAGTNYQDQIRFDLLEKPFAVTGGPYQGQQGQILTLDGSESFSPPELGGIIEYAWDFNLLDDGDGGYSNIGEQVEFVNSQGQAFDDGTYLVGLRITTQAGQVEYDNTEVIIADAPPVCDAGGPYEIEQGLFLTFDGSASTPGTPSEPILAYRWHFGEFEGDLNEQFSPNLTSPEHFYVNEGEYTVTLTAYDIDSECNAQAQVTVLDVEPIVRDLRVVSPTPLIEGREIIFSAGTTTAGSAAEPIIQFIWSWDDGSPDTSSAINSELRRPTHRFANSGDFNVCLTVDDSDSLVSGCLVVTIQDLRPIARLSGDLFAIEGELAQFSIAGTRSGDRPGEAYDPLSYALIDWGDGSEVQRIENFDQTDLTHRFQADGTLTITMQLFDEEEDEPAIAELEIYVDDVSPTPRLRGPFTLIDGIETAALAEEGLASTWSAEESTPGAASDPITRYRWDWGDGSPVEEGPEPTRSHTYADDGSYILRLTAIDSDGSLSTISSFVNVNNRAPFNAVITTESDTVDFGELVRFEVSYEDVPADFTTVSWRMGEGSTYNNQRIVNHIYRELGIFTVRATLTDEDGGETIVSYDIEVTPAGPRILVPQIETIREGDLLSFEVELRAAESSNGGLDGPVDMRVLRLPQGMEFSAVESANSLLSTRFRFEWQTGSDSAGEHSFKLMAQSPSGITRYSDHKIIVTEGKEQVLVSLGGSVEHAALSLFKYIHDVNRETTQLERLAFINLGQGVGHMLEQRKRYFVTVPHSAHVAIVDEDQARLIRRVPVGGEPYALAAALDYVWIFDARRPQITAIDRRLKVYRKSIMSDLEGRIIAAQGISSLAGDRLIVLTSKYELLLLDPEAFISNQPSRAVLARIQLKSNQQQYETNDQAPVLGGILLDPNKGLIINSARGIYHLSENALSQDQLELNWRLNTSSAIRSLTLHQDLLWSASEQGLRRYDWPSDGTGLNQNAEMEQANPIVGTVIDLNQQSALMSFPESLFGEPTLITATTRQIQHVSSRSFRLVLSAPDFNPQKLLVVTRETAN